jgi:hypothetical protein
MPWKEWSVATTLFVPPNPAIVCAVMHRVRQLDCLSSGTGSSPVQRAISGV